MATHNPYREIETESALRTGFSRNSAFRNLVLFFAGLGWQGPLAVYYGLQVENTSVAVFGVFITLYFWGCFGLKYLLVYLNELVRR